MNFRIFDSANDLTSAAARAVLQQIESGARTIALSGGRTPQQLYQILGEDDRIRDIPLTWVVVDERYVPITDPQSNAGMLTRTLFTRGMSGAHRFLRFRTELGDPAATAREFEREWNDYGIQTLDLVLLGMGDDGHTASLFPGTSVLSVEDRVAAEVYVPALESWRVTLTKRVLREAKLRLVLAAGASKRHVFEEVRQGTEYPISTVTSGTDTWWFVDRSAIDSAE